MDTFGLSIPDLLIVAVAVVAVVTVGLWTSRNVEKTTQGFFLASGKMPWWLIGAAFVSTSVSSEQIVGTVGAAYEHGLGIANWEWFALPTYSLVIVLFIPIYLKNRITTVPEILTRRFGPLCGDLYSWLMMLAYVFVFLVPVLYGGSLALSRLTGWNLYAVLWTMGLAVGAYTIKGGLSSIMWTDALQCLMLVVGGVLLFFVALGHIPGGWAAMESARPDRFHLYHPPTDPQAPFLAILAGTVGVFLFYQSTNQVMIQRVLSARSTWDGIMGIISAGFINLLRPLVTCLLGLVVYHWIHEMHMADPLEKGDDAFPFALRTFAPQWGLRGVVLAGFLAAVMSTVSALTNAAGTIFALDVYRKLVRRQTDDRQLIMAGQMAAACSLACACLCAPLVEYFEGIFKYFQTGVTYVATPFISVLLLGILWRRANYEGALFGLIGGTMIMLGLGLGLPAMGWELHWLYVALIAQVIIMTGIVLVSLATPPPAEHQWAPFLWQPRLLSDYGDDKRRPWHQQARTWFAVYAILWCAIYWRFW